MRLLAFLVTAACLLTTALAPAAVEGKTYFKETFDDLAYQTRWRYPSASSVASTSDTHPTAKFVVGTGKWFGDNIKDKGFHTTKDGHIYGASAKLESPLSLSVPGRHTVIIQYSVKHEQVIECGGGFIKLFPSSFQPERLTSKSHFLIQFGPDFCGTQTRDVTLLLHLPAAILDVQAKKKGGPPAHFTQALFTLKNKIRARQDHLTHTYTLILNRDHTFQILIDGQVTYYENGQPVQGKLMEHIDWQSNLPEEKRDTSKPDQTNPMALDQLDAHWIGFELWQVKAGSVFDNILVTDSIEEAHAVRKASEATRAKENEMWQRAHFAQQEEAARVRAQIEQTRARQDKELAEILLAEKQKEIEANKNSKPEL